MDEAKALLSQHGITCSVSLGDLKDYFEADTPYPDSSLDEVLSNRFLVVHELVEIDEVKRMGLQITKDVIVKHLNEVDDAHLKATRIELMLAAEQRDIEHLKSRYQDIQRWSVDPTVTEENKRLYVELAEDTARTISRLESK